MNAQDIENPIRIAAHRGYAAAYPENTLLAIKAAVEAGVLAVEVDIQFSKDGVPILLHDTDFRRVANNNKNVFETSVADIKKIIINEQEKFSNKFSNIVSCTLLELVEYMQQTPKLKVFVEIKHESVDKFGVRYVIEQLEQLLVKVRNQCVIISYSSEFLQEVRLKLDFAIGYILTCWDDNNLDAATRLKPEFVICNHTKIPEDIRFRDFAWQWLLYEITDCAQLRHYSELGVQWVESMNPVKLIECLKLKSGDDG